VTASGKTDRRALPAPEVHPEAEYVAPGTPTEEALAEIWAEVLGVDKVGVTDDFFHLGGDSIVSIRTVARIRARLKVSIPPRALFDSPTIAGLAVEVDGALSTGSEVDAIPRSDGTGALPLSFAQQRLWFLEEFTPGSVEYNTALAYRLSGTLDLDVLRGALAALVLRHEALRTTFAEVDGQSVQVIHPHLEPDFRVVEVADLLVDTSAGGGDATAVLLRSEMSTPFDLRTGPLFRALVVREATHQHVLVLTMHHIVTDGWSEAVILRDLGVLYDRGLGLVTEELPEPPVRYVDWAVWQQRN
ncbi:condensation domain-containing protein, partial [Actinoalloteichus spitiensis]|uniref:condensation domain-containing protein n=1 Tax=Actinoalloteichus spitiensis TaxID=252394 RepID=UPI000584BE64